MRSLASLFQEGPSHICAKKNDVGMREDVSIGIEEDEFNLVMCNVFLDVRVRVHEWVWLI